MTDEEINIAIAEDQGWRLIPHPSETKYNLYSGPDGTGHLGKVPNYANSLDAIIPVVSGLPKGERSLYIEHLNVIAKTGDYAGGFTFASAQAKQHCIAYLKTKGKL